MSGSRTGAQPVAEARPSDEAVVMAAGTGARTAVIASRLHILRNRAWVLARLKRLAADGLVVKDERYSADNDYYWRAA